MSKSQEGNLRKDSDKPHSDEVQRKSKHLSSASGELRLPLKGEGEEESKGGNGVTEESLSVSYPSHDPLKFLDDYEEEDDGLKQEASRAEGEKDDSVSDSRASSPLIPKSL